MPHYNPSWIRLLELENEWEQEKRQLLDGLLWGGVALIILGVALAFLCIIAMIGLGWIAMLVLLCGGALTHWTRIQQARHDAIARLPPTLGQGHHAQ